MIENEFKMLEDSDFSIFHPHANSRDMLICFSGRRAGFVDPFHFSFYQEARGIPANTLFLRDNTGRWYFRGFPGLSGSLRETARVLGDFAKSRDIQQITVVGVSAGTSAAMIVGTLMGAQRVFCLGCISTIHPDQRRNPEVGHLGPKMRAGLELIWNHPEAETDLFDVRGVLQLAGTAAPAVRIHHDPDHQKDSWHAQRLADLPTVTLVPRPGFEHDIKRFSKDLATNPDFLSGFATERGATSAPRKFRQG